MNALDKAVLGIAERLTKQEDVQKVSNLGINATCVILYRPS